jgi:Ca2+-binding EF-hand superfamily protein
LELPVLPARSQSCGDANHEDDGNNDDNEESERALNLLQEQLEKRVPLVRRIHTPPPWKPPWENLDDKALSAASTTPSSSRMHTPRPPEEKAQQARGRRHAMAPEPHSAQLLSQLLDQMIPLHAASAESPCGQPAVTSSLSATMLAQKRNAKDMHSADLRRRSKSPVPTGDAGAAVAAFRNHLSKHFGNLTRAFRAMKNAASLNQTASTGGHGVPSSGGGSNQSRLTCSEFEWCISAYLHYADRKTARKLFSFLDHSGKGEIGLLELAQQSHNKGLMSLIEFRRALLDRHVSLAHAFRELEDYLNMQRQDGEHRADSRRCCRRRAVALTEFVEATAFFGLDAQQATHFYGVMDADGDGKLTLNEFLDALTHMPREILLHDFRQRLLLRYPSVAHAFRDLIVGSGHGHNGQLGNHSEKGAVHTTCTRLDVGAFSSALARLGIVETEAIEIFRLADDDSSGDVSLEELRDALRDVAPNVSLEGFWLRFAAEWPEVLAAAEQGGQAARRSAGALILELLPHELKQKCGTPPSPVRNRVRPDGVMDTSRLPAATLVNMTLDVFDAIAALLDISSANALDIFNQIFATASLRRKPVSSTISRQLPQVDDEAAGAILRVLSSHMSDEKEVHIEDFLEQLQLWTQNPLTRTMGAASSQRHKGLNPQDAPLNNMVQSMVAPTRAAIAALKAELAPRQKSPGRPRESAQTGCRRQSTKVPKPPWQAFSTPRHL